MSNNVQEILNFLYKVATTEKGFDIFDDEIFHHGVLDTNKSIKSFDKNEIYNELTDFAFLTLYNNSLIRIDDEKLYDMVKKGIFVREVNNSTFEGMYLERLLDNGKGKIAKEKDIIDRFNQKSHVKRNGKFYEVTTKCPSIVACNYQSLESVDPNTIVQIIRNSLIHNRFREVSDKEKELYSDVFEEDVNGKGYIFKNFNNSIDILVTESWLREFKKVYFLDSYCYVSNEANTFYFPRFITPKDTLIRNEEELESVLNSILHTRITIYDTDKNFMNTSKIIEEDLFCSVYSKDEELRYKLKNIKDNSLKEKVKEHHIEIEKFIRKTLEEKGYRDFKIEINSESLDERKKEHYEFWNIYMDFMMIRMIIV